MNSPLLPLPPNSLDALRAPQDGGNRARIRVVRHSAEDGSTRICFDSTSRGLVETVQRRCNDTAPAGVWYEVEP